MKKIISLLLSILFCVAVCFGCGSAKDPFEYGEVDTRDDNYRTYYEIFVKSFYDSDGDGVGDLKGVVKKLDYVNDGSPDTHGDLGATGIWLMPVNPSPSYHKYDVTDYKSIDPSYGTMADFEALIAACKTRGIKLVMDLVLNHTSSRHPWFTQGLSAYKSDSDSKYKTYYNFSRSSLPGYASAGDGVYYEANFSTDMPDLNLDNTDLRTDIKSIAEFWLDKGVGGFRLDAVKHAYSDKTKSIEFWTWFNGIVKAAEPTAYLVGEVWSAGSEINEYYATGMDSFFDFDMSDVSGSIVTTINTFNETQSGQRFAKKLETKFSDIKSVSESSVNAPFISNHDQGRSYAYFRKKDDKAKLAAAMLLLQPGSPFVYYGEELGMIGSGRDENKRLPMMWGDASGACRPPDYADTVEQVCRPVSAQTKDYTSLLSYYRNLIRIREEVPQIARGKIEAYEVEDQNVCAFTVEYEGTKLMVLHFIDKADTPVDTTVTLPAGSVLKKSLSPSGQKAALSGVELTIPSMGSAVVTLTA